MARIPDETIQAIRDRVDIADLVQRHVALRQTGRTFKGLCPFHSEKTPSFHVHPERQIFHCFGCEAGGDVFGFLMKHENLSFPEAVRVLGRECGIEVPEERGGEPGLAERLREANEVAQRLYRATLAGREGGAAREYLQGRGFPSEEVERFGLGFAPARWDGVVRALAKAGLPAEIGARAGLLAERARGGHYDRLRGRITFPIRDVRGGIVGFGGRALAADQEPKYLNSPESPIFRKREAFYGFPEALEPMRRSGRAVVVEGYFDWLALQRAGVGEGLATCGTAVSTDHARNLRRRTGEVVLFFDGDEAGRRAMERALAVLLPQRLRVRAAVLETGDDPDSCLAREGTDALRRRIDEAPPALEIVIRDAVARGGASPWERADVVASVAPLVAAIPDAVERDEFVRRLALLSGTRAEAVEAVVREQRRRPEGASPDPDATELAAGARVATPRRSAAGGRIGARLARVLIDRPEVGSGLDPAELQRLVGIESAPWDTILPVLVEAGRSGRVDVASVAEQLGGEAAAALRALAASEDDAEPQLEQIVDDTLRRLRERQRAAERRATTRQFLEHMGADSASGATVAEALLAEKQRQLEERRAALGIAPPAPSVSPAPQAASAAHAPPRGPGRP